VAGVTAPLRSSLTVGTVRHRRLRPKAHAFTYRTWHALLDLDELDRLEADVVGFGHRRRGLATFRDTDHLGPVDLPVREKLSRWLAGQGVALPDGPVLLHTNTRPTAVSRWWSPRSTTPSARRTATCSTT
jgi:uncharacterized protein